MKNLKPLLLLLFISCCALTKSFATDANVFENVKKVYLSSIGTIRDAGQVKGYYLFYKEDKADRKNSNYGLNLLDADGRAIKTVHITMSNNSHMVESAYNGEAFLFVFFDAGKKCLDYLTYSKDGKELGKKVTPKLKMWEMLSYEAAAKDKDDGTKNIFPAGSSGFIRYGYEKDKKIQSVVEMLGNDLKTKWTWKTDANDKMMNYATYAASNDNFLISIIMRKKSVMAKEYTNQLLCIDIKTGKQKYTRDLEDKGKYYNCSLYSMDNTSDDVLMVGEYFDEPNFLKDNSEGIFAATLNADGKFSKSKLLSWTGDVSKKVKVNEKGKLENKAKIFFHRSVKTSDGKIYVIGEQYKRVADGMGIASKILSGGRSADAVTKIQLLNLMVFQLADDFTLENVSIFEKMKRGVSLPQASDYMSTNLIAYYLKATDQFDYEFTQVSPEQDAFSIVSIVKDRDESGKKKEVVGTINLTADKNFVSDKIELEEKGAFSTLLPAKSGYVMLMKYFKKQKQLKFALEKINID